MKIGGNTDAVIQVYGVRETNDIGEDTAQWADAITLCGWLDMQTGDSPLRNFNAKIQESTHVFVCDYKPLVYNSAKITPEQSRLVVDGESYDVKFYDDVMNMHQQLEIYLAHTGGQDG